MLPLVITVRSADGSSRRYAFAESPVSIGRSPFAELQLTEPFVSRWEGSVRFDEREVTYFILGSTNPTYVDGREIKEREQDVPIGVHAVLAIGELELRFSREPVPEADLRRKGKRRPASDARADVAKTMFLDPSQLRAPAVPPVDTTPSAHTPTPADATTAHPPPDGPAAAVPDEPAQGAAVQHHTPALAEAPGAGPLQGAYARYREAWDALLRALTEALEQAPEGARAALAEQLQRRYPRAVAEPEFRALLTRMELPLMRSEVPEVRAWLHEIGKDVLPPKLALDTGLTLERIFRLLEILTQSLAEINGAQDAVRSRWLGRMPRRSVLRSENGRVVLAYLLNPKADFGERVAELEQTIREAVTHELALFKATLDAARKLLDALSPESLEQAEGLEPGSSGDASGAWWTRVRGGERPELRLWRRLVSAHAALRDGDRYQRFFLGRMFAQSYLRAMGQTEPSDDR